MTAARNRGTRSSLWGQVLAEVGPERAATRYTRIAWARAEHADPAVFAASAREDVSRLAAALGAVLGLHTDDGRGRCASCAMGPFLVEWPCRTRKVAEDGLRHGWPAPVTPVTPVASVAQPDADPEPPPGPYEGFALAVLASHDILPSAGGRPPVCRACQLPPGDCPVWALAEGFLGLTWSRWADTDDRAPTGNR